MPSPVRRTRARFRSGTKPTSDSYHCRPPSWTKRVRKRTKTIEPAVRTTDSTVARAIPEVAPRLLASSSFARSTMWNRVSRNPSRPLPLLSSSTISGALWTRRVVWSTSGDKRMYPNARSAATRSPKLIPTAAPRFSPRRSKTWTSGSAAIASTIAARSWRRIERAAYARARSTRLPRAIPTKRAIVRAGIVTVTGSPTLPPSRCLEARDFAPDAISDWSPDWPRNVGRESAAAHPEPRHDQAEHEAADVCEEGDAPAVRVRAEEAEVRLVELVQEPEAEEEPRRDPDREDDDQPEHTRVRIEDEVRAEHRRDRAARAEVRDPGFFRGPGEQRHRRLRDRRDEPAGHVEEGVAEVAERVLDVLPEHSEEEHVPEDVIPAPVHEHRGEPADLPRFGRVAGPVERARVERSVRHRRVEVRQLVEEPDREVRRDDRDRHDREAAGRNPV